MARYIKANPKVVEYLNLKNDRNIVNDGNYLLWQNDMLAFGPLTKLPETLAAIGAIALMPHEAREEQDGVKLRPLPTATDERFVITAPEPEEIPDIVADNEPEQPNETDAPNAETDEETTEEPETANNKSTKK